MTFIERYYKLELISMLIKQKRTGSSADLAEKVGISERHLRRYLNDLRDLGAHIEFCRYRNSYVYTKPFSRILGVSDKDMEKIRGGFLSNGQNMAVSPNIFNPCSTTPNTEKG